MGILLTDKQHWTDSSCLLWEDDDKPVHRLGTPYFPTNPNWTLPKNYWRLWVYWPFATVSLRDCEPAYCILHSEMMPMGCSVSWWTRGCIPVSIVFVCFAWFVQTLEKTREKSWVRCTKPRSTSAMLFCVYPIPGQTHTKPSVRETTGRFCGDPYGVVKGEHNYVNNHLNYQNGNAGMPTVVFLATATGCLKLDVGKS